MPDQTHSDRYFDVIPHQDDRHWLGDATHRFKGLMLSGGAGGYLLMPVLTEAQRDALTPAAGMTIYNSTQNAIQTYNGSSWTGTAGAYLPLAGGTMTDFILFADAKGLKAGNVDGNALKLQARDSGVGLVDVARLVGAADPYFEATLPMVLKPAAAPGALVEGHVWYDATWNCIRFQGASAAQSITESQLVDGPSVDLKTLATTTVFTVPAGRTLYDPRLVLLCDAFDAGAGSPVVQVGSNSPDFNNFKADLDVSGLNAITKQMNVHPGFNTPYPIYGAGSVFSVKVSAVATGTTWSLQAVLTGHLF